MKERSFRSLPSLLGLLKQSKFWLVVVIFVMSGFVIYLEGQIIDLETRLVAMQEGTDDNKFGPRITNLEYIINDHTKTLHEHSKDIWSLDQTTNELNWRLDRIDWATDAPPVAKSKPISNDFLKDFNPNPGNVPLPQLTEDELKDPTTLPDITKHILTNE